MSSGLFEESVLIGAASERRQSLDAAGDGRNEHKQGHGEDRDNAAILDHNLWQGTPASGGNGQAHVVPLFRGRRFKR